MVRFALLIVFVVQQVVDASRTEPQLLSQFIHNHGFPMTRIITATRWRSVARAEQESQVAELSKRNVIKCRSGEKNDGGERNSKE